MSSSMSRLARDLQSIISESDSRKTKPYDSEAQVVRVDGDYVYVHFAGGVDETPVRRTIEASVGDTVQVRVSGGRAWLIGNATAPPTDDKTANKALGQAGTVLASVQDLEDTVDKVVDDIEDISSDVEDLDEYTSELNEALTSTNNHFWVDDRTGAVYVSMEDGDATTGYAMRHASSGIVLLHDNEVLTSWTGSGQAYYSDGERVALYSSDGAIIGSENGSQINISSDTFSVIGEDGIERFNIGSSDDATADKTIVLSRTFPKRRSYSSSYHVNTRTAFTLPVDTLISYSGRSTGSFTIDANSEAMTIFQGVVGELKYVFSVFSANSKSAGVVFENRTDSDLVFTFSYKTEYDVPLITSSGTIELGGNISAEGSGEIGGDLSVTGDITCNNIGLVNSTNDVTNNISDTGSTWTNTSAFVQIGPGTFVLMGRSSFAKNATGYRSIRIFNEEISQGYAISTEQVEASSVSNTVLRTGTLVSLSSNVVMRIQVRQTSGSQLEITSQLRYCRII